MKKEGCPKIVQRPVVSLSLLMNSDVILKVAHVISIKLGFKD